MKNKNKVVAIVMTMVFAGGLSGMAATSAFAEDLPVEATAEVASKPSKPEEVKLDPFCHSGDGKNFEWIHPANEGQLNGHQHHSADIFGGTEAECLALNAPPVEEEPPVVVTPPSKVKQIGLYCYEKLDGDLPAAWENSGPQTLVASRAGDTDWTEAEKRALCDVPPTSCEPVDKASQSDWVEAAADFTFPATITYPVDNIGWPPIYAAVHTDLTQTLQTEDCGETPPPTNKVCVTYENGPTSTDLVDLWSNVDTRSQGRVEYVEDALHVWTLDNSTNAKVSEGIAVSFALKDTGVLGIDVTANPGNVYPYGPGLNLFVDFDNDGTRDGTLVYETVYGQDLWLTNGSKQFVKDNAPVVGGGNGSQWHGTINEWLTKFPDAQVSGVAYSLGSGVEGDWNINSITFNCTVYTFDLVTKPAALEGEDVVTDVDCLTETHSTTTTPWTQAYVVSGSEYVLGEKVYGEPTTVTREATNAELNEAECPAPEPPVITPTVNTTEKVSCEATQVSGETTTTTPTYTYVEADREWVRGEDDVKVVPFTREKNDAEKLLCVIVTSVPPALVQAGTDPQVLFSGALAGILIGFAIGYARKRRAAMAEAAE